MSVDLIEINCNSLEEKESEGMVHASMQDHIDFFFNTFEIFRNYT